MGLGNTLKSIFKNDTALTIAESTILLLLGNPQAIPGAKQVMLRIFKAIKLAYPGDPDFQ